MAALAKQLCSPYIRSTIRSLFDPWLAQSPDKRTSPESECMRMHGARVGESKDRLHWMTRTMGCSFLEPGLSQRWSADGDLTGEPGEFSDCSRQCQRCCSRPGLPVFPAMDSPQRSAQYKAQDRPTVEGSKCCCNNSSLTMFHRASLTLEIVL